MSTPPFSIAAWIVGPGPIGPWRARLEPAGCREVFPGPPRSEDLEGRDAGIVARVDARVADLGRLLEFHRGHEAPWTRLIGPDGLPAGLAVASPGTILAGGPDFHAWESTLGPPRDWNDCLPIPRRPAVFLDRDGTVIEEVHYLADPARVRLISGAAAAIRLWESLGFARVIVSNQSGVGRGLLTVRQMDAVNAEMVRQLAVEGASIDAIETCTDAPNEGEVEAPRAYRGRRKPGPGMLCHAAAVMGLDLPKSWAIGDMLRDLQAGWNAGCVGRILVRTGKGKAQESRPADFDFQAADDLLAAAELVRNRPRWA
ncbi:MAG: HAD-IIIA family hydrolase [Isosphaeraceae bacterium]